MKLSEFIQCEKCGHSNPVSAAFSAGVEEEIKDRIESFKQTINKAHERERAEMKVQIEDSVRRSFEAKYSLSTADLKAQLSEASERLKESQQNELALLKLKRELESQKQAQDLELQRQLEVERQKIIESANLSAQEAAEKALREKAYQLAQVQKALDEANRKLAQGSQQVQGESLEAKFEELLPATFPQDEFQPVSKGTKGADIIQLVKTNTGAIAGKIIQEYKVTQRWSDEFLVKLKADQREAEADVAIIVTVTPPKGMGRGIEFRDGVWIATPDFAVMLIWMQRLSLLKMYQIRNAALIATDQKEEVFQYLTGRRFAQALDHDIELVNDMIDQLRSEKLAFGRIWKNREASLNKILMSRAEFYSDVRSILGRSLPVIERLELMAPNLESDVLPSGGDK